MSVTVRPGTAEQLARLAHFRALEILEVHEMDAVAHFLIGDVGGSDVRADLWNSLREGDAGKLWHLVTDDWDTDDLDEPAEDLEWWQYSAEQMERHRYEITRTRLEHDIETAVWRARYVESERRRSATSRYDPAFDALVSSAPIVDNASSRLYAIGQLEYGGPVCGCGAAVDDNGDQCPACAGGAA